MRAYDIIKMEVPLIIREQIIDKYLTNIYTQVQISHMFNVPTSTVNDIVQRYRQTGEIESRKAPLWKAKEIEFET